MKVAYIAPQYLPSTSGDVRELHNIASKINNIKATVFTTDAGSEDAIFSNKGVIKKEKIEFIDGVEIRRYPIEMRFLSFFKFLANKDRFMKSTDEINDYIKNFKSNKFTNFIETLVPSPPISRKLYKSLLQAKDYDLYHVYGIPLSHALYAYKASIKNKIPLLINPAFHTSDKFYYKNSNFKILKHADAIIANTAAEIRVYESFGVDPNKIHVVGCGIDLESYSNPNNSEIKKIKDKYSFEEYELNLLFLSRLQKEKGIFNVIESVIKLNKENKKVQLLIAGSNYENNSEIIKNLSRKHDFIKYLGRISEEKKINIMHACDALTVPSIVDSFGIIYIESWACKKPIIGADIPSTRSLISYGKDGFYTKYNDNDSLIEKIEYFLENPDEITTMGNNGYAKVKKNYVDKEIFKKTYQIYMKIINQY